MATLRATLASIQHDLREAQSDYGKLEIQLALLEWRFFADQSASPQQITHSENSQFDEFRQSLQQKLEQYREELSSSLWNSNRTIRFSGNKYKKTAFSTENKISMVR